MASYLVHYNMNHDKRNGQFAPGDGDGDGQLHDRENRGKRNGVYSAKIENYHPGTMFKDPYYVDKRGNKRSYMSYEEMPVEAQNKEKARAEGKKAAKELAGVAITLIAISAVVAGTIYVKSRANESSLEYTGSVLNRNELNRNELNRNELNY